MSLRLRGGTKPVRNTSHPPAGDFLQLGGPDPPLQQVHSCCSGVQTPPCDVRKRIPPWERWSPTPAVHAALPISIFRRKDPDVWKMKASINPVTVKTPPITAHICVMNDANVLRSSCIRTCIGEIS